MNPPTHWSQLSCTEQVLKSQVLLSWKELRCKLSWTRSELMLEITIKGVCQSCNPAPPLTLQLTDQNHNASADAAAGVGSTAAAAAAAPDPAQVSYEHLKEVCKCVDKSVKEVLHVAWPKERRGIWLMRSSITHEGNCVMMPQTLKCW